MSLLLVLLYLLRVAPLLHSTTTTTKEEQQRMRTAVELDEYSEPSFYSQTPPGGNFLAAPEGFQAVDGFIILSVSFPSLPSCRSLVLLLLYFFRISPLHSSTTKEEQQQMRTAAELDEYSEPSFDSQTPLRGDFRAETAAAGAGGGNFRVESGSRAAGKSFAEEGNGIQSSSRHGLVSSADVLKNPSAFRELLAGKRGWWGEEGEGEDGGGVTDGGLGLGAGGGAERGSKEWGGGGAGRQGERQERGNAVERQASKDSREKNDNGSGDSSGSRSGSRLGGNPGAAAMGSPGDIPVVQFLRARTGCGRGRYAFETLKQARRLNSRVILIGPRVCKRVMEAEGVQVEDYEEYKGVEEAFEKNVGEVVSYQCRWSIPWIFYMDCDVPLSLPFIPFIPFPSLPSCRTAAMPCSHSPNTSPSTRSAGSSYTSSCAGGPSPAYSTWTATCCSRFSLSTPTFPCCPSFIYTPPPIFIPPLKSGALVHPTRVHAPVVSP
ncbi:unnamed protein product [Closterium sp. NIES-53]